MVKPSFSLNGHQLKLVAVAAMFIDHLAWGFVETGSGLGQAMHAIGRLTAPIMCFFIAEGYFYTRSFWRYFQRLLFFALLSQIPFTLFFMGEITLFPLNVIYTLSLSLLALYSYDHLEGRRRNLALAGILFLSIPADWTFLAPLLCLSFHIHRGDARKRSWAVFSMGVLLTAISLLAWSLGQAPLGDNLFHLAVVFSLPFLHLYNGERGGGKYSGWFFYLFYPLHLLLLWLLLN